MQSSPRWPPTQIPALAWTARTRASLTCVAGCTRGDADLHPPTVRHAPLSPPSGKRRAPSRCTGDSAITPAPTRDIAYRTRRWRTQQIRRATGAGARWGTPPDGRVGAGPPGWNHPPRSLRSPAHFQKGHDRARGCRSRSSPPLSRCGRLDQVGGGAVGGRRGWVAGGVAWSVVGGAGWLEGWRGRW